MSTPGDDEQTTPPPPEPTRPPDGGHVDKPAFGDGGTGEHYTPRYDIPPPPGETAGPRADPNPSTPPPPVGTTPSAPLRAAGPTGAPTPPSGSPSRRGMIAPIAAAIVLIGGSALLVLSGGSDDTDSSTGPRIAEVNDPDDPRVESTVPRDSTVDPSSPLPTSPPLVEQSTTISETTDAPSTTSTTTTTTTEPTTAPPGGPTQAQLDDALLRRGDIGPGDWTEEEFEPEDFCGTVPDEEVPDARADVLFRSIDADTLDSRVMSNTLLTYPTAESAERAFTGDIDLLLSCDATTIDVNGVQYRVQVDNDPFTDEALAEFPCSGESAFVITQLTNQESVVPYIGVALIAFRCGRNITVTGLTTTISLEDLNDESFSNAAVFSNVRTGNLPGS